MPRETHKAVRDAQRENGSIWRKEIVQPGGLEEGSEKEIVVQKGKQKDQGGEGHQPKRCRKQGQGSSRVEKDMIAEINDAVGRGREAMPKEPPSTGWIRKGGVIRVFAEEVTVVATVSRAGKGSRVTKRLRKVNLNEIPAGSKCVRGLVGKIKKRRSEEESMAA
jgi:hypothetical protein